MDEFLAVEAGVPDGEKWELLGGVLWKMMAGGTMAHNVIIQNIAGALRSRLRAVGSPCRPFTENLKIVRPELGLAAYPDVVVDCGPFDPAATALSEPSVLVEVLSPATRAKDIGEKGPLYRRIPSVKHILFVAQATPEIEIYGVAGDGFQVRRLQGLEEIVHLEALGMTLSMREIYQDLFA
ncbi:Uma2 family endonuclease [Oharaeibacter diazotrophicus]|uniref:Uma2 family endonuclease n=1 Tax=Oharaeibacter diazotrophicus TaxID=1920512 RepID=UPI0013F612D9|nr:Uma2 family endonuclease [Oharaeibacter diazotrophicus]